MLRWERRRGRAMASLSLTWIPQLLLVFMLCALAPSVANAQTPDENRLALLYSSTNGDGWVRKDGWDTNDPVCDRFGITCNDDDQVTDIRLTSNNLIGNIPPDLYQMDALRVLDVQDNQIVHGGFSGLVDANNNIEELYFAQNSLTTIEGIGGAPDSLVELHLTQNALSGPFPVELTEITSMERLYLSFNRFTGTLPTDIGRMTNLVWLYLYDNLLTGQLPTEIGRLQRMEIFTLAENPLAGTIPSQIESMLNLRTFSLHNNQNDIGKIGGRLPLFKDMPHLVELYLDGNEIGGTVPTRFLQHTNVDQTMVLGLSNNKIEGVLPTELGRFSNLNIDLVGNKIEGIPQELCDRGTWMAGLVEQFGCDGILCPSGFSNPVGRQQSDDMPCEECEQAEFWGTNRCGSKGGGVAYTEFQILALMFSSLRGPDWKDKQGWQTLQGILSDQDVEDMAGITQTTYCTLFTGIECNDNDEITKIELPNNGLVGELPYRVFELPALETLVLARNSITIEPTTGFAALATSTTLQFLNLAGTKVTDVTGIGEATSLRNLVLDGIDFISTMPADLFELTDLKRFHCQYNSFIGTLPTTIGDMTGLEIINLYGNELSGSVPSHIGLLNKLRILDLSENNFLGELPDELSSLVKLEKFHIHQTAGTLRGSLPAFDTFPSLTDLELDSNSFSGSIPSNFLKGVSDKQNRQMNVGLSFNDLIGGVPKDLKDFGIMNIRLEGNKFNNIPVELCAKSDWMDGEVGAVGSCDAIMCPPETWNLYGKASSKLNATCMPCPAENFYGNTYCGSEQDPNPEKTILDRLYDLTGGRYWKSAANWTTPGVGICYREGIICATDDDDSGVLEIRLNNNSLQGLIPPDVYQLPDIRFLGFSNNEVDLSFFGIESATKLRTLHMSNTKVQTLDHLGNAPTSLTEIYLANNQIGGAIPNDVYFLQNVQTIFLEQNMFTGSLSSAISGMSSLVGINLSQNSLKGHLPSELGLLVGLTSFNVSENELSGVLPTEIAELVALQRLDLSGQRGLKKLSGSLSVLDGLAGINVLDLSRNSFNGKIPDDFLASSTGSDMTINLAHNELTGAVPLSLDSLADLRLFLEGNQIDDLPGQFCDEDNAGWMEGAVGSLGCDAILCPPGKASGSATGRAVAGMPCEPCANGVEGARYFGSIACTSAISIMEREILEGLYRELNGTQWIEQVNWMSERGVCTWFGVGCDSEGNVTELSLESNNLESSGNNVSQLLFSLSNLQHVDLKGNFVPLDFEHIPTTNQLTSLKLSDTGLRSLKGIGRATNLKSVHITNNAMTGVVPPDLFSLNDLQSIFMSYNSFSGTLSTLIGSLTNLVELYMFQNRISGEIPTEVGKLTKLTDFIMPNNYLQGSIPTEFSSLPKLEQLSLYDQKGDEVLSGPLPSLEAAPFVWYFDVSKNDMTGEIPDNFMQNSAWKNASVTVNLDFNDLQGVIPASLDRFDILYLGVVGNKFTSVPEALCDNSRWMNNAVGAIKSCDAIACAKGSYTRTGKQEIPGANALCTACDEYPAVSYVGQTACGGFGADERDVLQLVYSNTGGENWIDTRNWNTNSPICTWTGVNCTNGEENDDSGVTLLDLENNNLIGQLPSEVFMLSSLEVLRVGSNPGLHVTMDGLENAKGLEVLHLSRVKLTTIDGIARAVALRELHLTDNGLTGTLPEEVFTLTHLKGLFLNYNLFSGKLPSRISQLTNLVNFYAFDNDFSGNIPNELGALSSLNTIVLSENLFEGEIPPELSSMPQLTTMSLYRVAKSGPRLTGPLPPFDQLPSLLDLYVDHNDLVGTIPKNFLASSPTADIVNLGHNRLSGAIPSELDFLENVFLQLEANEISAYPPQFCDNVDWMDGDVGSFGCDAFLCPPQSASVLGRRTDTMLCESCDSERAAIYFGSVTCNETLSEKRILNRLYQACGGRKWYQRNNWANDDADPCDWYGVKCDNTGSVTEIRLPANNLVGTPFPDLFELPRLQVLDLSYNPLNFIFEDIKSAPNLFDFRIDGVGLSSLKGVERLSGLSRLDARYNTIESTFPQNLLQMSNLRILNLGQNRFIGPLPTSFSALRYLRVLRLGSNGFIGPLPSFADMNGLKVIDLSENALQGPIPNDFMERISPSAAANVNLAQNRLTGTVPEDLGRFKRLTIYLRENMFVDLPESLCNNGGWNDGSVDSYGCDAILCPPGTVGVLGRQRDGNTECEKCDENSRYYGEILCDSSWTPSRSTLGVFFATTGSVVLALSW